MFKDLTPLELDIVISGLRLVRRSHLDVYIRNKSSDMLQEALDARRILNRRPESIGVLA